MSRSKSKSRGNKNTGVFCWKCLAAIDPVLRFRLDYAFVPRKSFRRPFSAFGFCAKCSPQKGLRFFVEDRSETIPEGNVYSGVSVSDPERKITVLWTRAQSSSRRSTLTRLRNTLFSTNPKCACGAPATDLHHVIPRYWFRLNRIPETAAHFLANLLPICSSCNQRWYNFSVFAHDGGKYWAEHRDARITFDVKLAEALSEAHKMGLKLYRPPELNFEDLPGQPVLTRPDNNSDSILRVAAFIDVFWWIRTQLPNLGPRGMAWRGGSLAGQGNPYMVLVEDIQSPTMRFNGPASPAAKRNVRTSGFSGRAAPAADLAG